MDVTAQCREEVNLMVADVERENKEQYGRIESKFNKLTELMKQQVGLRRLIKRNRKLEEQRDAAVKAGSRQYTKKKREEICKIPFIVASYVPDRNRESLEYNEKSLKLTSVKPVKCYGDANILSMMQLSELKSTKDFAKHLGEDNQTIPNAFLRTESLLEQFSRKYNPHKHAVLLQALHHSPHAGAGKGSLASHESVGFTKLG